MIVTSTGIIDGVIQDQYGGRGTQFNENGVPTFSLPLKIEEAPERTKTPIPLQADLHGFTGWLPISRAKS